MSLALPRHQLFGGICFLLLGLLSNPWLIAKALSPDGRISDWLSNLIVVVIEAHLLAMGFALLLIRTRFPWRGVAVTAGTYLAMISAFIAYNFYAGYRLLTTTTLPRGNHTRLHERDELLGWKPIPNISSYHQTNEYSVTYVIDDIGARATPYNLDARVQLFVIGDSNTFGLGVNNSDTFASVMSANYLSNKVRVINLGVSGFGFVQMMQRYLNVEHMIRPGDVVLLSPISWDIPRNSAYMFSNVSQDHTLNSDVARSFPSFAKDEVRACFLREPKCLLTLLMEGAPHGQSVIKSLTDKLGYSQDREALRITEIIKHRVEQKGAKFVLAFLPTTDEIISRSFDVPVTMFSNIDLFPYIERYQENAKLMSYKEDGHYNPYGHRVIGQTLARVLWDKRLLDLRLFSKDPLGEETLLP
jgi:hypothetical protein